MKDLNDIIIIVITIIMIIIILVLRVEFELNLGLWGSIGQFFIFTISQMQIKTRLKKLVQIFY